MNQSVQHPQLAQPAEPIYGDALRSEAVAGVGAKSSRLAGVDLAKGIAIFGVLVHHVATRSFRVGTLEALNVIQHCCAWAIFIFFLSSGFLRGTNDRMERFPVYCARRAKRLLIPYFTIGVVYLVWLYGLEVFRSSAAGFHWGELLRRLAGYAVFREFGAEQMYFLPMLFFVAVMHEGGLRLLSHAKLPHPGVMIVIATFVTALVVILTANEFSRSWSLYRISLALLYYSFGYLLATVPRQQWIRYGALLSAAGVMVALVRPDGIHPAVGLTVSWIVFCLCEVARQDLPGRVLLESVGEISAFIFIYHSPLIIHPIIRMLCNIGLGDWWVISLGILLTVAACAGLYQLASNWRPLRLLKV